jgi:hypothetical protein
MNPYPRLSALLDSGRIIVDGRVYIGLASDSVWVWLGNVGEESNLEEYLTNYSTPATW